MSGAVPSGPVGPKLDRAAIERIIQRAAELQASEKDIGDGLTESELFGLGRDVGIPDTLLRQALLEERTRSVVPEEQGFLVRLAGPRLIVAARAIAGEHHRLETVLHDWMADGELLTVKRRYPEQISWEPKQGAMASLRRAVGFGGRGYTLTRAREVVGQVVALDPGRCHVRLVADLSNTLHDRVGTAVGLLAVGVIAGGVAVVMGFSTGVAVVPVVVTAVAGWAIARSRRQEVERVQVALEQVLDRLEQGEAETQKQFRGPRQSAFVRIADELLKKALGEGEQPK